MIPDLQALQRLIIGQCDDILSQYLAGPQVLTKPDGSIVTEVDLALQERLQQALQQHFPGIPILGEEMSAQDQDSLLSREQQSFWCLDPLDGTSNFAAGVPFYSVSIALIHQGLPRLGVVYDPVRKECFSAQAGHGAYLNDREIRCTAPDRIQACLANVDFKRLRPELAAYIVQHMPFRSQRNFGSCALEWCWLAAGRIHLYLHGGMKLWDYAAGSLLLSEAGGYSSTLEGEEVFVGKRVTRSVVAATSAPMFQEWCQFLSVPVR